MATKQESAIARHNRAEQNILACPAEGSLPLDLGVAFCEGREKNQCERDEINQPLE